MRGVVFVGDRRVELRDLPEPEPGPGEVLLKDDGFRTMRQ